ncbi:MAG: class I SAM-dependent methyltransferase [Acidobacteriales bacterium]|nr:class I SAM-dependent methyltransferase [Terriglobales bacterium]
MLERESYERISREARQRLHPSITSPHWLILRARRKLFTDWAARVGGERLRILDVGGRIQPYRPLFGSRVHEYYSLDIVPGPFVSVMGSAEGLPFGAGLFDVVICTQMLEFVPSPQKAMDEVHRVLRSGGYLLLSVPAIWPRDSGTDYWRFLPSSLRLLLREFSEVQVAAEGSTITGMLRTLNVALATFTPRMVRPIVRFTVIPALNALAVLLEGLARTDNDQLTANFSALARK